MSHVPAPLEQMLRCWRCGDSYPHARLVRREQDGWQCIDQDACTDRVQALIRGTS